MKIKFIPIPDTLRGAAFVAVGSFQGESLSSPIKKKISGKRFEGKAGETLFLPAENEASVLLIGLGKKDAFTLEKIRRAASRLLSQAKASQNKICRFDLQSFKGNFSEADAVSATVEGARLADYRFNKYKSKPSLSAEVEIFEIAVKKTLKETVAALTSAEIIAEGVLFTRDIANEPANVMTPVRLAQAAKEMASKNNLSCVILGLNEIKRLKMGGVLGVSQGSTHPPQFVVLENKAKKNDAPIILVGKGVTFDTGGISIKPSGDMDKMKFDMCGAAAVMGAMKVIANLNLPVRVIGITPLVENMPGSTAQRPGDIITCLNGKTVEVLNTDAEGRLILADALAYAERYKPRALVDIATLTGACSAAFGDVCSGLMSTDPDVASRLKKAGEKTGELLWELPLWEEYRDLITATYADIQNISKKNAGTITAGMFLKEFAGHTKSWAHLDVAGTAWTDKPKPLSVIGSTGVGVRLFVEFVKSYLKK